MLTTVDRTCWSMTCEFLLTQQNGQAWFWFEKMSSDRLSFGVDDYRVRIDQDGFQLILYSLLGDCCRFSSSKLLLRIWLIPAELHKESFIVDGSGIQNDHQCISVFNRFVNIEEYRNAGLTDGGGPGLPLLKSLMEGMGGSASCSSPDEPTRSGRQGLVVTLRFLRPKLAFGITNSV